MKAKSKIILTSVATIALSAGLAVGGTFALFTSEDQVNIAVTAGKVKVDAEIANLKLYSAKAATASDAGAFQDENDAWYVYDYQGDNAQNFSMGGSASVTGGTLTLTNAIPGDKVEFDITIDNQSNVGILYRTVVTCEEGQFLYNALDFGSGVDYNDYKYYKTAWTSIDANASITTVPFSVALPMTLGNAYQEQGCKISFKVEAVQGNATVTEGPEFEAMVFSNGVELEKNDNADNSYKLESAFAGENATAENVSVNVPTGATVTWKTGAGIGSTPFNENNPNLEEVNIQGSGWDSAFEATGSGVGPISSGEDAWTTIKDITVKDSSVSYAEGSWEYGYLEFAGKLRCVNVNFVNAIMFEGEEAEFIDCTFNSNMTKEYAVWVANGKATFTNCTFTGPRGLKTHEAYGSEVESIVVDGCSFVDISEKPGMAIGTVNAATSITIKNSEFISVQAGDQGLYAYETDTDVTTFNFVFKNNDTLQANAANVTTIGTKEELFAFAKDVNENGNSYSGKYVKLTADIDLNDEEWTPIGQTGGSYAKTYFQGTFDGRGYTISNLKITQADEGPYYATGLFGFIDAADGDIKNLIVDTATIKGHHYTGVIVGYLTGKITSCTVKNAHIVSTHANNDACGDKSGVIVGYVNGGTVTSNKAVDCTVKGGRDAGQIAGAAKTTQVYGNTASNVTVSATGDCPEEANIRNAEIGRLL